MGIVTPLQLIAVNGLLANQGLKTLPSALTTALANFNSTTLITNFNAAVVSYLSQPSATNSTLTSLLSIGNATTACATLGNSIPDTYTNLNYPTTLSGSVSIKDLPVSPYGFSGLIQQTGNAYLGNGSTSQFAQGFLAVQGYLNIVNSFINSMSNSQSYLGPTFTNMSNLTTNNISLITSNMPNFAVDLHNTGRLINTKNLSLFGTPAGLLQQLATVSGAIGSSLPGVVGQLKNINNNSNRRALTDSEIRSLVNDNRVSLFNPSGLPVQDFDRLQKIAFQALSDVTGADLQDLLTVLDISTPNIETAADLLDLKKIFPNSYQTLQMPTASGQMPIYLNNGSVDLTLAPIVNNILPTPSGCDELGKIIPPDQAVANKAFQSALQQITNVDQTPAPALANSVADLPRTAWNPSIPYLADSVVAEAVASPAGPAQLLPTTTFYRAQQDVPVGTNISDTAYWQPYIPNGLSTMSGLPLIEALDSAVPSSIASSYASQNATGTGPDGTITICDVIGTAIDHWNFATRLNTVTNIINPGTPTSFSSALSTLAGIYSSMVGATESTMPGLIANANTEIGNLKASYPTEIAALNTEWNYIANYLNQEKGYQIQAGIDYFQLLPEEKISVYALTQALSQIGTQNQACGPAQFLQNVVDQTTLTGQAVIGALREAENQSQLAGSNLVVDTTPSSRLEITPANAVTPVN